MYYMLHSDSRIFEKFEPGPYIPGSSMDLWFDSASVEEELFKLIRTIHKLSLCGRIDAVRTS